jgi:hypothetical protein
MKIIEEVLAALMRTLRLCQRYQVEQKARHDEKDHYVEEPGVRLFESFYTHQLDQRSTSLEEARHLLASHDFTPFHRPGRPLRAV